VTRTLVALALALGACGRVSFDARGDGDGGTAGGGGGGGVMPYTSRVNLTATGA